MELSFMRTQQAHLTPTGTVSLLFLECLQGFDEWTNEGYMAQKNLEGYERSRRL